MIYKLIAWFHSARDWFAVYLTALILWFVLAMLSTPRKRMAFYRAWFLIACDNIEHDKYWVIVYALYIARHGTPFTTPMRNLLKRFQRLSDEQKYYALTQTRKVGYSYNTAKQIIEDAEHLTH